MKVANVLFVDNPVGTGYSYVDNDTAYTTDVAQIANDLVSLFQAFLKKYPIFEVCEHQLSGIQWNVTIP